MNIERHLSAQPDLVQQDFEYFIKRNTKFLTDRFPIIFTNSYIVVGGVISYLPEISFLHTVFWCELAGASPKISYPFLLFSHLSCYNHCLVKYHEKVAITFGKITKEVEGANMKPYISIKSLGVFHYFVYLALILRDKEALAFYPQIQLQLKLEFQTDYDDRHYEPRSKYVWCNFLQAICKGNTEDILSQIDFVFFFEDNEAKKVLSSYPTYDDFVADTTTPFSTGYPTNKYQEADKEALQTPLLRVFQSIYQGDTEGFNKNLIIALEKHKLYYSSNDIYNESRNSDPYGWVSIPLVAACAIAYDKGMKREVTSDYIPEWLVKGEFEGLELVVE